MNAWEEVAELTLGVKEEPLALQVHDLKDGLSITTKWWDCAKLA
jgi:hypothetical protein